MTRLVCKMRRHESKPARLQSRTRLLDRGDDVSFRQTAFSFRESAFLFRQRDSFAKSDARTIESDAFAIVGVTFGLSRAPFYFRSVAFGLRKRHPLDQVTPSQSSA
jgi:hypothetical protein